MKNILYTIILSLLFSSSYAGSVDGKGVVCFGLGIAVEKSETGNPYLGRHLRKFIWFDNGKAYDYYIEGYSIKEKAEQYSESTRTISWRYLKSSREYVYKLDRQDLTLTRFGTKLIDGPCELIEQKQEIFDQLNELITRAKKHNKI